MELSKQVVSRELAEKMKELGFEQNSCFYWYESVNLPEYENGLDNFFIEYIGEEKPDECPEKYRGCKIIASAYSVAELGDFMPAKCEMPIKSGGGWFWKPKDIFAKTEADCRAKILVYIAENNLINPREIKL